MGENQATAKGETPQGRDDVIRYCDADGYIHTLHFKNGYYQGRDLGEEPSDSTKEELAP